MLSKIIVAASIVAAVSAQSSASAQESAARPDVTPPPTTGGGSSEMGPLAFNVPEGGMAKVVPGEPYEVSYNTEKAPGKSVTFKWLYGPSTNLIAFASTVVANEGAVTLVAPKDLPTQVALEASQDDLNNYSEPLAVEGGNPEFSAAGESVDSQSTGTAAESSAAETGSASSDIAGETVTGTLSSGAARPTEEASSTESLPTETEEAPAATTSASKDNAASSLKFSSAALIGGLVAAIFVL